MKKERGISLIVLVIVIIVIIILATTIIVTLTTNNPINITHKAVFKSDIDTFKSELFIYNTQHLANTLGIYNKDLLYGNKEYLRYNGKNLEGLTMTDVIYSMKNTKYETEGKLKIVKGELVYVGDDSNEEGWLEDTNIGKEKLKIDIIGMDLSANTNKIKIKLYINEFIPGNIETEYMVSKDGINYITTTEINTYYTLKEDKYIYNLDNGTNYFIKVKVTDRNKNQDEFGPKEITTTKIVPPEDINLSSTYTNQNVVVNLKYTIQENIENSYNKDNTNWVIVQNQNEDIVFEKNGTIFVKSTDKSIVANNEIVKTGTIYNIDKLAPNNFIISLTNKTPTSFEIIAKAEDKEATIDYAKSGIGKYKYYVDGILKYSGVNEIYKVTNIDPSKTHIVKVEAIDNAGNITVSNNIDIAIAEFKIIGTSNNEIMGTVDGSGSYIAGTTATLTANKKEGYKFIEWSDGNISNPRQLSVNSNQTYIAKFDYEVLTNIQITATPNLTSYSEGQKFKNAGMIVKAVYDTGRKVEITKYTYPNVQLSQGQNYVVITYTERGKTATTNQSITVGPQLAVYEKYNSYQTNCYSCGGSGRTSSSISCSRTESYSKDCSYCGGSGTAAVTVCSDCRLAMNWPNNTCHCGNPSGETMTNYWSCPTTTTGSRTCSICNGSGSRIVYNTCNACSGYGKLGYERGSYISNITVQKGSYPSNGRYSDGYWYVYSYVIAE